MGCSASTSPTSSAPQRSSLHQLARESGPDVALVAGDSDFSVGSIRYTFLVITPRGAVVKRPLARVYVADALDAKPFERATAVLEPVGTAASDDTDVTHIYVAHLEIRDPGKYWVLAEPIGGRPVQGLGNLLVRRRSFSPAIGARAFPSATPTLASAHGDIRALTTRIPPDRALLRYSIAGSLRAHKPFVVVFATPKFCTSRTCGPVVDVVDALRREYARAGLRFIHVEIYRQNDPTMGFNLWVRQWHLPTEPWVFLVGGDGRIKAKFEGSVSVAELRDAIRRRLL